MHVLNENIFQMTREKGLRPTSPVHVHVDDDVPVHVHVKQPKKKGKSSSVSFSLSGILDWGQIWDICYFSITTNTHCGPSLELPLQGSSNDGPHCMCLLRIRVFGYSVSFTKGNNYCDSLFLSLDQETQLGEEILS